MMFNWICLGVELYLDIVECKMCLTVVVMFFVLGCLCLVVVVVVVVRCWLIAFFNELIYQVVINILSIVCFERLHCIIIRLCSFCRR